jgi:DNA helicase HerA-like ATPase
VLMGISGAGGLREVLARLDTKQQAIILGHAVPMPVVVKTRSYDTDFYKSLDFTPAGDGSRTARRSRKKSDEASSRRIR